MMKEQSWKEETLTENADGQTMRITRRTLGMNSSVHITSRWQHAQLCPDTHITRVFEGRVLGPRWALRLDKCDAQCRDRLAWRRKSLTKRSASDETLTPVMAAAPAASRRIEEGLPRIRDVRVGRRAAGRDDWAYTSNA